MSCAKVIVLLKQCWMNAALRVPPLFKCIRGLGPTVCGVGGLPLCGGGEREFFPQVLSIQIRWHSCLKLSLAPKSLEYHQNAGSINNNNNKKMTQFVSCNLRISTTDQTWMRPVQSHSKTIYWHTPQHIKSHPKNTVSNKYWGFGVKGNKGERVCRWCD